MTVATNNVVLPAGIQVLSEPSQLPNYDSLMSGISPDSWVKLDTETDKYVSVIRTNRNTAAILADTQLYGQSKSTSLFQQIRSSLHRHNIDCEKVYWCTNGLIDIVKKSRTSKADSNNDAASIAVSDTEAGLLFDSWVRYAVKERATDIHIIVRGNAAQVRFRIDGELEDMRTATKGQYVASEVRDAVALVYNKLMESRSGSHSQFMPNDFLYCMIPYEVNSEKITLRFQSIKELSGYDVIMRLLKLETNKTQLTYAQLGYSTTQCEMIEAASAASSGIIMIAGVTGSGKSTTLKTIMESIPGRDTLKLYSVEDPVEYKIKGVTQIPIQRNVKDAKASEMEYRMAYASLMRADPDVIMIGEIRDPVSGIAALTQAETGHMALGTVHANRAIGIVQRLVSPAIGLDLHALTSPNIMNLLIYQALVPVLCEHCKIPVHKASVEFQQRMLLAEKKLKVSMAQTFQKREGGCDKCFGRGSKGMTVVAEIIRPDRDFLKLIRNRQEFDAEEYIRSFSDKNLTSANMNGKTVFEHTLFKSISGMIDGLTPERFERFEYYRPPQ